MDAKDIVKILAKARFKFRSDDLSKWEEKNPILLSGEFGVVKDGSETEKVKIGDGITPWNDLTWWKGPKGDKGDKGDQGEKGDTYTLTEQDKVDIGNIVLSNFIDISEVGQ